MHVRKKKRPARPQVTADVRAARKRGHGAKPESVRERAILAILSEKSLVAAARRCDVSEKTLRRWLLDDPDFKRELAEARSAIFEAGMARVQAAVGEAIETLVSLMGRKTPASVRLAAAKTITDLAIHEREAEAILRRLSEIEAAQRIADSHHRRPYAKLA